MSNNGWVIAGILVTLVLIALVPVPAESLYPLAGVVTDLDYEHDLVVVTDAAGNDWGFSGIEDWDYADIAAMIMDDRGTEDIRDDVIVDISYAGYYEYY